MITENFITLFTTIVVLIAIGCSSCQSPVQQQIEKQDSLTIVDYNPSIAISRAKYRDSLKIYGKHFGEQIYRITIYLDSILIKPIAVNDSCVTLIIPINIPLGTYNLSIMINDNKVNNFTKLVVVSEKWGNFFSAQLTANLYSEYWDMGSRQYYGRPRNIGTHTFGSTIRSPDTNQRFTALFTNNTVELDFDSRLLNGVQDKYSSESSSSDMNFHATIDIITKTVSDIYVRQSDTSMKTSAFNGNYNNHKEIIFRLNYGTYKEIDNGIEITIDNVYLQQSIQQIKYYDYKSSGLGTLTEYIPAPPYSSDNYIVIKIFTR